MKTVHGPDFYANKKHKGDGACHVKKEDPDGVSLIDRIFSLICQIIIFLFSSHSQIEIFAFKEGNE